MVKSSVGLPPFLKKYFWDIHFEKLDPTKRAAFIIERILEFGDEKAIRWMAKNFDKKTIQKTLCNTRRLSEKSANFWGLLFKIPKGEIRCLKKPFLLKRKTLWPY